MKYCPECGTGAQDSEIFCSECGERFSNKRTPINFSSITANVFSTIISTSKKIITKIKSDESKETINKIIKNKKIVTVGLALTALLALIIIGSIIITASYSPKKIIKSFQNAIINNDVNKLETLYWSNHKNLEVNTDSLQFIIDYLNSSTNEFDNTLDDLYNDIDSIKLLSYEGSQALLDFDEIFALTIKEKNWFFTKYGITIKPLYFDIS